MTDTDANAPSFESLYAGLPRMARRELFNGVQVVQMSPTTLLHEACLQMSARPDLQFADRAHFLANPVIDAAVRRGRRAAAPELPA
jgi:hypothetical protein